MLADYNEAKKFLDAFGPTHTFQTFPDHDGAFRPYANIFNGTFDEHFDRLQELNEWGHGVFFTVNETNLRGRKKENVVRVRSLFVDNDDNRERAYTIEPSIIVKTPNGTHVYWFINENVALDEFEARQTALIKQYDSDTQAKDLPRVLRVVGFYHQKKAIPTLIELIKFNPELKHELGFFNVTVSGPQKKHAIRAEDKTEIPLREGSGSFKNVICGGCPALTRLWRLEHVQHRGRLGLLSIALQSENGLEFIKMKWPSEVTDRQIDYAIKNNLSPFTCRTFQEDNICIPTDRITSIGCFPAREGRDPSPVRLLGGVKQAFKGKKNG